MARRPFGLALVASVAALASLTASPGGAHDPLAGLITLEMLPPPGLETVPLGGGETVSAAALPAQCPATTRVTSDRPDIRDGRLVHVIYFVPADTNFDKSYDKNGILQCSLKAQDQWFTEQTGGYKWRWDTFIETITDPATGTTTTLELMDVTFVKSAKPNAQLGASLDAVVDEVVAKGFNHPQKRYLIYSETGSTSSGPCGVAAYPSTVASNVPADAKWAAVWLRSPGGCSARQFGVPGAPSYSEVIAQQEILHNDGMVPYAAPHTCGPIGPGNPIPFGHVCTAAVGAYAGRLDPESVDILFPFTGRPLTQKRVDPGNDDYFDHPFLTRDLNNGLYLDKPSS